MINPEKSWSFEYEKDKRIGVGTLLLAEPFMDDDNFRRAVVLVCRHDADGTHGLLLNKPIDLRLQDVIENFPLGYDGKLLLGGPVGTDLIQVIHNRGTLIEGSMKIADGVYWGGNFEQIKKLIRQGTLTSAHLRFFIGYSGWDEGQLDLEVRDSSWIITTGANELLFYHSPSEMWKEKMQAMGGMYKAMALYPESPMLN
jgi:putative transcriptional regulator